MKRTSLKACKIRNALFARIVEKMMRPGLGVVAAMTNGISQWLSSKDLELVQNEQVGIICIHQETNAYLYFVFFDILE